MSSDAGNSSSSSRAQPRRDAPAVSGPAAAGVTRAESHALHTRSFKLRFAPQRELGRSAVRPLRSSAPVTDKFYSRKQCEPPLPHSPHRPRPLAHTTAARIGTTAQQYGWWLREVGTAAPNKGRPFDWHIRDSCWLKAQMRILAADAALKHN